MLHSNPVIEIKLFNKGFRIMDLRVFKGLLEYYLLRSQRPKIGHIYPQVSAALGTGLGKRPEADRWQFRTSAGQNRMAVTFETCVQTPGYR